MNQPVIATVYLPNGVSQQFRTTPGQWLKFFGGKAEVIRMVDMPHVLMMADAHVQVNAEYKNWLPEWVEQCGILGPQARVDILLPDGDVSNETVPSILGNTVNFEDVVFGKHKPGHQCKFCLDKRKRAAAAVAA